MEHFLDKPSLFATREIQLFVNHPHQPRHPHPHLKIVANVRLNRGSEEFEKKLFKGVRLTIEEDCH